MCEARSWNKLYTEEVRTEESGAVLVNLVAERSDYELFRVSINVRAPDYSAIAEKVKRGFEVLESYRNCDCRPKIEEVCIRHVPKFSFDLEQLVGQSATR